LRFFIAVKIPYFCPLCLCFSNFGSRLITGCERFISGSPLPSPLCHLRLVHRFQSPPGFPPQGLFLRSSKFAARTRALYNWRPTDVVSLRQFRSGERSEGIICLTYVAMTDQSYTDLPLCQSQTNVPSLLAVRTFICDFDTLPDEEREPAVQCIPYASNNERVRLDLC
jgi:hypothetical protein